jgi:hypothetical protein
MGETHHLRLGASVRDWWATQRTHRSFCRTLSMFFVVLWEFARESTPEQRRRRYGDIDYDWEYRVDTTSATVSWRDHLLGMFQSPYQPTEPVLFREMLGSLAINFSDFTFIDLGSGKGRVLLMASDRPFRRILGVELLPELHRVAMENRLKYQSDSQQCVRIESICADARQFVFPAEPSVLYLFNPLAEEGLRQLLGNLELSIRRNPRVVYVLYHNPALQHVFADSPVLKKISGTHQYSVYKN